MTRKNRYAKVYAQELKRIEKQVNKLLAQGYAISIDMPKVKQQPTKSDVQRLKKITPDVIQKSSESLITDSGYKSKRRKAKKKIGRGEYKSKRRKAKKKRGRVVDYPSSADIIIENFINTTYTYFPVAERMCRQWLENSLRKNGKEATAEALEAVPWLTIHESYDAEKNGGQPIVPEFLSELSDNLGLSRAQQKEFLDSFDYENGWGEY
ncbi:unknown [Bacteroides sp. CAG:1076]|jgi:hypothetical protein|nr:unknown [Bacteroides sp. CAG:1076]